MRLFVVPLIASIAACSDKPKQAPKDDAKAPATLNQPRPFSSPSKEAYAELESGLRELENMGPKDAGEHFKKAIALDPTLAAAYGFLALSTPGPEGEKLFEQAQRLSASLHPHEKLLIDYIAAVRAADPVASRRLLLQLVSLFPEDARLQYLTGDLYIAEKKYPQAIEHYGRAARIDPKGGGYNMLGYSQAFSGRLDEAVQSLQRYVESHPGDPNPPDSLGEVALMAGDLERAEAAFRKSMELDKTFIPAIHGIAFARFFGGDWKGGLKLLEESRTMNPMPWVPAETDLIRGWALAAAGRDEEALKAFERAEEASRMNKHLVQHANIRVLRATLLGELGRHEEARKDAELAVERLQQTQSTTRLADAVRTRVLLRYVFADAAQGKIADAERSLALLVDEGKRSEVQAELRIALVRARAAIARAKGDLDGAIKDLRRCNIGETAFNYSLPHHRPEEALCVKQLYDALQAKGDTAAMEKVRAQVLSANRREPQYLFVRAKLTPKQL